VLCLLLAAFVGQGVRTAALPTDQLVAWNVVIDDGFYYLQIARNIARGHGSTFDRINPTNGYQPLWALTLVPVFWFTDSPEGGLKAAIVISTLLGGIALLLLYVALQRLVGLGTALVTCGLVVTNPYFLKILTGGLETPLLFALLAGTTALWALRGERVLAGGRRACLGLGLLLGLLVLTRLDLLIVLCPLGLVLLLWPGPATRTGRLLRAAWIALPVAVLVGPYLLWNLVEHGSAIPVSGLVKGWAAHRFTPGWQLYMHTEQWRGVTRTLAGLTWPWALSERQIFEHFTAALAAPVALAALLGARLIWSRRARANRLALLLVLAGFVGTAAHGLYIVLIYRASGHWNYHYFFPFNLLVTVCMVAAPALLLTDLSLLLAKRGLRQRLRRGLAALAAALSLVPLAYLLHHGLAAWEQRQTELQQPTKQSFRKNRLDLARLLPGRFPDAVLGAWWAGTLGYFSDMRVVNLDGVVNSGRYFREVLRPDTVDDYLLRGPITHLADHFWRDPLTTDAGPQWRIFWWEYEKHYRCHVMRRRLKLVHRALFRGAAGFYVLAIDKRP
jgi:4-amino-4-deoxy-L-arabinose transferase-like glycosyltransferase